MPVPMASRVVPPYQALGLSLGYTSTYFLPMLTPTETYLFQGISPLKTVVQPALVALLTLTVLILVASAAARKWTSTRVSTGCAILVLAVLVAVTVKGFSEAAGYHWQDTIPRGRSLLATQRYFRAAVLLIALAIVWSQRRALPRLVRILSSVGFAFALLALVRLMAALLATPAGSRGGDGAELSPVQEIERRATAVSDDRARRVVWVIFDETDFDFVFGPNKAAHLDLPNFDHLAQMSVFAVNANSPASATFYSIPALLTGVPVGGQGVRIDRSGALSLERADKQRIPFNEASSVFGALRERGQTQSVLGFLHPYCQLFDLTRCAVTPEVGALSDALLNNLPDSVVSRLHRTDTWKDLTSDMLTRLPNYLASDDALTFLHLNMPHLTAHYADTQMHLPPSKDPLTEYSRNLALADRVLGQIMQSMRVASARHDELLVVSSDHWLRNRWYRANEPEVSRRIPLMMWKVGETQGIVLDQPLSTVHTAEMILAYLQGDITDQREIARWWVNRPVYPSFISPDT